MKPNSYDAGITKCETSEPCTRDAVGTVRFPVIPIDRPTCTEHAGGKVIWYFGKRSPYKAKV